MRLAARLLRGTKRLGTTALAGVAALVCLLALGGPQPAQADRPPYFAITGAKIVPVSGPPIEGGTVVIADGLIVAVGKDVAIPPEAWVIDGKGLTVYPGLIDAMTNHGLAVPSAPAAGAGPPGGTPPAGQQQQQQRRPPAQGPEDRPGTTPWENAADELNGNDAKFEQWRNAGFTTVVSVPAQGIFPGMGAVINTAGDAPRYMVVKAPATLQVTFSSPGGFTGFPGSLMGTLAYVKQVLLDAIQYAVAQSAYAKNPKQRRPTYDRSERVIQHLLAAGYPVMLPGNTAPEMARAMAIADEFKLKAVIYGAQEGYDAAATLAAKKYPVLVNLRWPEKQRDADPEADEPLSTLRFRDRALSSPAALHKAGVKFAFYSGGITAPADIAKNVKKSIDAGLPAEAALRALTLDAAEILGVADQMGSIEPGKIANLVVTDGDLFGERTKVKMVFVDGAKFEPSETERPTGQPSVNLNGTWTLTVQTPDGPQQGTATLTMTPDGALTGTLTGPPGTANLERGSVSGNRFTFTVTMDLGEGPVQLTFTGTVEGNSMTGTMSLGADAMPFTGTRPSGADVAAVVEGGTL